MPDTARALLIAARLLIGLAILGQEGPARGQGATRGGPTEAPGDVELAVNGPEGSVLFVDGQAAGRLPLSRGLLIRPGPHRFSLEKGSHKLESEALTLPPDRQAELNLAVTGRSLVAVLHITPGLLLLQPERLAAAQRSAIAEAVAVAARQQHAVLLDEKKAGQRRHPALLRCIEGGDCHESLAADDQVSYVLSLRLEGSSEGESGRLRAALLDVRTRELSATAEEPFRVSDPARLPAQVEAVTARLLNETTTRPRGSLAVTSEPAGARVLVDGRWLGVTPFQQEVFAGRRSVEVQRPGYVAQGEPVLIAPGQVGALRLALRSPPAQPGNQPPRREGQRPLWRVVTGGIALGGGLVMAGFGTGALLANGRCHDPEADPTSCSPYYDTTHVGAGLFGAGAALSITGVVLLTIPPRPGKRGQAVAALRASGMSPTTTATTALIDSAAMRTRY